jgi:nitroreductase
MDAFDCIATKLEVTEFSPKPVPTDVKRKVLEAARLSPSGINAQHWRFIMVDDTDGLRRLASDSTTGAWVAGANFAVVVLTNPKYGFHIFDAGRVVQNMELAAWNYGVSSRVYTGVKREEMERDFGIPGSMHIAAVVGFGYPARKLKGKKKRKKLTEIAYQGKFGEKIKL